MPSVFATTTHTTGGMVAVGIGVAAGLVAVAATVVGTGGANVGVTGRAGGVVGTWVGKAGEHASRKQGATRIMKVRTMVNRILSSLLSGLSGMTFTDIRGRDDGAWLLDQTLAASWYY